MRGFWLPAAVQHNSSFTACSKWLLLDVVLVLMLAPVLLQSGRHVRVMYRFVPVWQAAVWPTQPACHQGFAGRCVQQGSACGSESQLSKLWLQVEF